MTEHKETAAQQVRRLFIVLATSITVAAMFVGYMAYYHGPTGQHTLGNILLNPEMSAGLSYVEQTSSGSGIRMRFHGVEYVYQDGQSNLWKHAEVSNSAYSKWYQKISGERSILNVAASLEQQFSRGDIASLQILVRPESSKTLGDLRPFQEVQFSPDGNHFRVELHVDDPNTRWAYFYVEGIAKDGKNVFVKGL